MAVLFGCGHVSAYYGLRYDPKHPAAGRAMSTFVPENASVFKMTQPDGAVRRVYKDRETQSFLMAAPWMCESDESNAVCVRTEQGFKGGETIFFFRGGLLERLVLNGRSYPYEQPNVASANAIPALWEKVHEGMMDAVRSGKDIWTDGSRFRLKFGRFFNPNTTAALLVELALLAAALLVSRKRWLLIPGLAGLIASLWFLQRTLSRGGLLAFAFGLVILLGFKLRGMFTWRRLAVGAAILVLAIAGLLAGVLGRGDVRERGFFAQDERASRTVIWRAVPRMMVSAPHGWGAGNAGQAYVDWFQPLNHPIAIADMVSGHLTRLVEHGWAGRYGYLLLWMALLACSLYGAISGGSPLPLAMWSAFGVADCFSYLNEEPILWLIPLLTLGWLPFRHFARHVCGTAFVAGCASLLAGLVLAAFWLTGLVMERGKVRIVAGDDGQVTVNGVRPSVWLVRDDAVLDGGYQVYFGKELREHCMAYPDAPALGVVRSSADLPATARRIVLAGRSGVDFLARWKASPVHFAGLKDVVFLSPPFTWKAIPREFLAGRKVTVGVGAIAARLSKDYDDPPDWVDVVPESELYLPGWTEWLNAVGTAEGESATDSSHAS